MSNNDLEQNDATSPSSSSTAPAAEQKKVGWERDVLEKLALFTVREQRARRRWGIFFKIAALMVALYAIWAVFNYSVASSESIGAHTALIDINGNIEPEARGSASAVIPALEKAFAASDSVGVIMRVNSPGGSPVQAGMIYDEIVRLRKIYPSKPLYVVVEEMCASGCYYFASAADKIYVNRGSIVGSIGVLMDGFGFTGLMDKLGVERRLLTAGENKGFLDPFSPQVPRQKEYAKQMLADIHQQFIDAVRAGRGTRLKESPDLFSGLFWTGARSIEFGLADGYGTVDSVARDVLKQEDIVDYTQIEGLPERVLKKFGVAVGSGVGKAVVSAGGIQIH